MSKEMNPLVLRNIVVDAYRSSSVSFLEFVVIFRYYISCKMARRYYIPRMKDRDSNRVKNNKRIVLKFLYFYIAKFDGVFPSINNVYDDRIYFDFRSRIENDTEKIRKIILNQTLSITGIELSPNIKIDPECKVIRMSIRDKYGSSEIILEDIGVSAIFNNGKNKIGLPVAFKEDIELIEQYKELGVIEDTFINGAFTLAIHTVDVNRRLVGNYSCVEDILVNRFSHLVKELCRLCPYDKYRISLDWDALLKKNINNLIN